MLDRRMSDRSKSGPGGKKRHFAQGGTSRPSGTKKSAGGKSPAARSGARTNGARPAQGAQGSKSPQSSKNPQGSRNPTSATARPQKSRPSGKPGEAKQTQRVSSRNAASRNDEIPSKAGAARPVAGKQTIGSSFKRRPQKPKLAGSAPALPPSSFAGDRIAKIMARAGICSRREAEQWILAGRVAVDGKVLTSPAVNIENGQDVRIDGAPLVAPDPPRLWRLHKPIGRVTSDRDPQGRPTIYSDLPKDLPRLLAIGRLDINTEGLLLLTNDGALKRYLELPDTGWQRRYRVRAFGRPDLDALAALRAGITIDGVHYRGIHADFERQQGDNAWLTMSLREGKNREIKIVLEHLGLTVNRLIRLSFGPFQLGNLASGQIEEVPRRILRQQLGAMWHEFADGFDGRDGGTDPKAPARRGDHHSFAQNKPITNNLSTKPDLKKASVKGPQKSRPKTAPKSADKTPTGGKRTWPSDGSSKGLNKGPSKGSTNKPYQSKSAAKRDDAPARPSRRPRP